MNLRTLVEHFSKHKLSDMGPVEEYVRDYKNLFRNEDTAKMGAFVSLLSGTQGGRWAIHMAVVDIEAPATGPPASSYAGADGVAHGDVHSSNLWP